MGILEYKYDMLQKRHVPPQFKSRLDSTIEYWWIDKVAPETTLELRNADHVRKALIPDNKIELSDHEKFLENYASLPRIDFLLKDLRANTFFGGVNLVETDIGLEIGKFIGKRGYLGQGLAKLATFHFIQFLKVNLRDETDIYAKTKINNKKNIELNKSLGFSCLDKIDAEFVLMFKKL